MEARWGDEHQPVRLVGGDGPAHQELVPAGGVGDGDRKLAGVGSDEQHLDSGLARLANILNAVEVEIGPHEVADRAELARRRGHDPGVDGPVDLAAFDASVGPAAVRVGVRVLAAEALDVGSEPQSRRKRPEANNMPTLGGRLEQVAAVGIGHR